MEGKEESPHIVMRNIRQFMSGMKNYLVKNGEREFEKEIEKERLKLKANEFLNLDAILEGVMMKLVVRPLREHVYKLFVVHYGDTGSLRTLADSIQYAQGKHIQELGIRVSLFLFFFKKKRKEIIYFNVCLFCSLHWFHHQRQA